MNQIRSILEDTYQLAASSDSTYSALSESQERRVNAIIEKAESQRGVLAVLITSLVKKIETPSQDVRYHQAELSNGYSGRVLDTRHITPFMKEKFRRFAMGESGWTTRTLEQPHPYTLEYPARIKYETVKDAFLQILNDIEENKADPKKYLRSIFSALITLMEESKRRFDFLKETQHTETVTIDKIVDLLRHHFSHDYGVAGASRLPVLAVYSAYEMLMEIERYEDKTLAPLKSHTAADTKSHGIGDIEVLSGNNFFEAVEIKHNIPISLGIVEAAYQKFAQIPVSRYYLLTTAEPNVEDVDSVNDFVSEIHRQHGCEVIVNGILPSLKYYLRLVSSPQLFLENYSNFFRKLLEKSSVRFSTESRNQRTTFAVLGNPAKSVIRNQSAIGVEFSMKWYQMQWAQKYWGKEARERYRRYLQSDAWKTKRKSVLQVLRRIPMSSMWRTRNRSTSRDIQADLQRAVV